MMMMPMESSENRIIEITTALQNEEIVKLSSLFSKRMTSSGDAASDTTTTTGVTAIEEGNSKKFIPSYAVRNGEGAITSSYIKSDPTVAGANDIQLTKGSVTINNLNPREQEKEDEPIIKGLDCLMNNEFMAAKTIFEKKAQR
ncbi:hypothetical protein BDF20DRAFT_200959 [Mycotypha africana]|uniref:uncharacterized protein n=1 Tax=Mycotypha africana TaxID=64632 RepID=UPI00230131F3|nr:uncharacterized protein BDF20DRAFT_200959 [Mycotypha africana]KAI8967952.1 hypothetical protein BDF20DRAFT_200959 [Mycotypha africana]